MTQESLLTVVIVATGHLYWANGILSHNLKVS